MITGDNVLTACHVAAQLKITTKPALILALPEDRTDDPAALDTTLPEWRTVDGKIHMKATAPLPDLINEYDLCISGDALPHFLATPNLASWLHKVCVFARVAPDQKVE